MKKDMIRLSVDITVDEHNILKMECAQLCISIKDFLHEIILKGLRELKKEKLKKSIKQSKEGKVKSRGSFAKYVENEI